MAKKTKRKTIKKRSSQEKKKSRQVSVLAISALVLNILLPGLGSIIAGRTKAGIYQLVLVAIALTTAIFFIPAIPAIFWAIAWIWGIITGIQLIKS